MSSYTASIRSGETRLISDILPDWILDEQNAWDNEDFISWEALLQEPQLHRFLTRLHPIPFYRYMTRYLLSRYPDISQEHAAVCALPAHERQNSLAQLIFAEIQQRRKSKPLQNCLTQRVYADLVANGFGTENGLLAGSLTDPQLQWDQARLREVLFSETIGERQLFLLALGLQMSMDDLTCFLQKVLLRKPLDALIPEEALLQICVEKGTGDRLRLYDELWKAYDTVTEKQPRKQVHYDSPGNEAAARLEAFLSQSQQLSSVTPELLNWMAGYKYVLHHYDFAQRPENQRVLKLFEAVKDSLAMDIKEFDVIQAEPPVGTVRVYYDSKKPLTIPAGTLFLDKDGNAVAESLQAVSTAASDQEQEISFEVFSEYPVSGGGNGLEKHQEFNYEWPKKPRPILKNKSKIKKEGTKCPDGYYYHRATLVGMLTSGAKFPAGTKFQCGDMILINREEVSFCYLDVPVVAYRKQSDQPFPDAIPRNTITALQMPNTENLTIEHSRLTRRQRIDKNVSLCMEFLYGPTSIADYVQVHTKADGEAFVHPEVYAALLQPILQGMRLTDTRLSQIKKSGKPAVKRHELLTVAFLYHMVREQMEREINDPASASFTFSSDAWEQAIAMQTFVNKELETYGFHPLYLPNPYDCLLAYLALCEEPLYAYKLLWGLFRGASKRRMYPDESKEK